MFLKLISDSLKPHNNTNELTDFVSDRPTTPVFCEVKLLILHMEFGLFVENDIWLLYWRFTARKGCPMARYVSENIVNLVYT